ncbi:hypothetical protein C8A05DRAFT_35756 [Staphylotrichum tortipilum]|uniref:Uncharacterized protein n=1 Tax=Staphylotrichum tortipilum TaxID=2831512 RepID=A0AAN6MI43_9PEZI|nr:hypothetical protein C8A05DRAFT_35756 [Staphylotrichum longicolle]
MASTGDDDTHPWNTEVKAKFNAKDRSEYLDPCQDAAKRSIQCLHRNGGDKAYCHSYFQAYQECKKAWLDKRRLEKK